MSTAVAPRSSSSHHSSSTRDKATRAPIIIQDRNNPNNRYTKGRFLGKGGFAKCYELTDIESNHTWAGKIVEKKTLIKYRAKEKLTTEIKIHRSLRHDNIVGFHRFFEDSESVYILLEVCDCQTMMELHKRRRILTEPETRYYLKQIVGAVKYMHNNKIIHRDLKLGNLFLDHNLAIKIGDFGLATNVAFEGERKKTLCGTPNYIAPEILDRTNGHSYPVDIWSIGCIIYTLLCGRPPFETSNIESTYRKIKTNDYKFPSHCNISEAARNLITWTLSAKPQDRPTLNEIENHDFMTQGFTPEALPQSSLVRAPSFDDDAEVVIAKPARKVLGSVTNNSARDSSSSSASKKPLHTKTSKPSRALKVENKLSLQSVHDALKDVLAKQASATSSEAPQRVPGGVSNTAVWISKWVDYSNKYGLGYQLSDGSVGVLFNDSTKMVLSPDQTSIESIERDAHGAVKTMLTIAEYPVELTKKVTLLKYFQNYMTEHLLNGGNQSDNDYFHIRPKELIHMKKWLRTKTAIVFRLSNNVIQLNFFNHTKLIVNTAGGLVTFINKSRNIRTYYLKDIQSTNCEDEEVRDMVDRMNYALDVIEDMLKPSSAK
eukprot:m.67315 g.67315  ORF g.67315 m.67315 type:complete len:601 (-) comp23794_c0_seq2:679-2481(-)